MFSNIAIAQLEKKKKKQFEGLIAAFYNAILSFPMLSFSTKGKANKETTIFLFHKKINLTLIFS